MVLEKAPQQSTCFSRYGYYLCLLLWLFSMPAYSVEIIVNRQAEVSSLSSSAVRSIFGMRKSSWPNGVPIQVFVLHDLHPLHAEFCKSKLGVFAHQLNRSWNQRVYSGTGQAPTMVGSVEVMMRRVASTPGAIGYVDSAPSSHPNVIKVDIR